MSQSLKETLTTLVELSQAELQRLAKPKAGFLKWARPMIELFRAHAEELRAIHTTPEELLAEVEAYEQLLSIEEEAGQRYRAARSTRALRGASLWRRMLQIYALARAIAPYDVDMNRAIQHFFEFMKQGPRQKPAQ